MTSLSHKWLRLSLLGIILLPILCGCEKKAVQAPTEDKSTQSSPPPSIVKSEATTPMVLPATPTKAPATTHGPRLRHPERGLVGEPEPLDPVRDRLRREFDGITANDPRFFQTLRKLWSAASIPTADRAVNSASVNEVALGVLLPSELKSLLEQIGPMDEALPFTRDAQSKDTVHMLELLAGLSGTVGGNHLPSLLADRANQLPPTDADLAAYYAVSQGIGEMNPSTNRPYLELWKPLTQAKNPIYRLLALKAGERAISENARAISTEDRRFNSADAPAKVAFFQPFLIEQDPIILKEAVRAMGSLASPDAKAALERFRASQEQAGNSELVGAADEALSSCESLLSTLKPER